MEKNLRKTVFCGGKAIKSLEKRLRAAGRRLKVSEIGFVRRERGRIAYALRTFPMETISCILINRIGTGCLKCLPLLSPLRCIWGRKHYTPTVSGAFVLDGIEQCLQKRFVVFLWHLSSRRMQKQKRPFARADSCI